MLLIKVGCGAIGCEMMKNYALLGISTADQGKVEKTSNLLVFDLFSYNATRFIGC